MVQFNPIVIPLAPYLPKHPAEEELVLLHHRGLVEEPAEQEHSVGGCNVHVGGERLCTA